FGVDLLVALPGTELPRPRKAKTEILPERDARAEALDAIVARLTEAPVELDLLRPPRGLQGEIQRAHQSFRLFLAPHFLARLVRRFGQFGRRRERLQVAGRADEAI